jgi:hypothetical protein
MSWKHRGTNKSNKYYYLIRRVPGAFRCDYLGKGPLAESVAVLVAERKRLRLEAQGVYRELAELERAVAEYHDGISRLFESWMRLSGWHRHCGTWRKTGPITRRAVFTAKQLDESIAAEEARCEIEEGNVAEFIEKYGGNAAWNTMNLIISQTTQDAWQHDGLNGSLPCHRRILSEIPRDGAITFRRGVLKRGR